MKGDEERCRAAGCSGYITKPINSECLLNTLAAVLPVRATAACEPAPKPEDEPIYSRLATEDPAYREIVDEFVEELRQAHCEIEHLAAEERFEELAAKAHWLKGSGGTVGFDILTVPAFELERAAKQGESGAVKEPLKRVAKIISRICACEPRETASV